MEGREPMPVATPKPFAPACERNREPILEQLRNIFAAVDLVLEIGAGTGQHAVFFAGHLPHLQWQPTDVAANLAGINAWRDEAGLPNVLPPLELDVDRPWPVMRDVPAIFSANTLHIMSWPQVQQLFKAVARHLTVGGAMVVYGPFNYHGRYTSESNAQFDRWLQTQSAVSAIRDFEAVDALAQQAGLQLVADHAMPANNRLLHWRRLAKTD
jgi:cyclopropane fatty-acyl-phospholipid synthase-like methyltransferase